MLGLVLLGTQFTNVLQYLKQKPVTPLVNVFGIMAEALVFIQGTILLIMVS